MKILALLSVVALSGCVKLAPGQIPDTPDRHAISQPGFPTLDPGAKNKETLHFNVHAYSSRLADSTAEMAEELYSRVMTDTGLYSFRPPGLYPIVVYATPAEFHRKTGLPRWSSGAAVGNAIYTYAGPHLKGVLAHEMTHLIFYEFMGRGHQHTRWLNEGLAVYEEQEAAPGQSPSTSVGLPIPFEQMVILTPLSEEQRQVNTWYSQVGSVVRFLMRNGGQVSFSQLLRGLRDGRSNDDALHLAYGGQFDSLAQLEAAWRKSQ
jgi:hypothetical protein